MAFNYSAVVLALGETIDSPSKASTAPYTKRRISSDLCLPERLPTSSMHSYFLITKFSSILFKEFIQREAETLAPKELMRQMLKCTMEEEVNKDGMTESGVVDVRPRTSSSPRSPSSIRSFVKSMVSPRLGRTPSAGWSNVQVCTFLYGSLLLSI